MTTDAAPRPALDATQHLAVFFRLVECKHDKPEALYLEIEAMRHGGDRIALSLRDHLPPVALLLADARDRIASPARWCAAGAQDADGMPCAADAPTACRWSAHAALALAGEWRGAAEMARRGAAAALDLTAIERLGAPSLRSHRQALAVLDEAVASARAVLAMGQKGAANVA